MTTHTVLITGATPRAGRAPPALLKELDRLAGRARRRGRRGRCRRSAGHTDADLRVVRLDLFGDQSVAAAATRVRSADAGSATVS